MNCKKLTTVPIPMRQHSCSLVNEDEVYLIGGEDEKGSFTRLIQIYNYGTIYCAFVDS